MNPTLHTQATSLAEKRQPRTSIRWIRRGPPPGNGQLPETETHVPGNGSRPSRAAVARSSRRTATSVRAIVISLAICVTLYLLVTWAVGSSLSISEIVEARDYSLAAASRPAFGEAGVWFTVAIAIIATATGLLASLFAVSRMLAMLTDMELIPHRHFGMPGSIQQHTLVYTVVVAGALAVLFDLSRIASIGAILYLVMDLSIHWGVYRHLRQDLGARATILISAMIADLVALGAFLVVKGQQDPLIVAIATATIVVIFAFETVYLRVRDRTSTG